MITLRPLHYTLPFSSYCYILYFTLFICLPFSSFLLITHFHFLVFTTQPFLFLLSIFSSSLPLAFYSPFFPPFFPPFTEFLVTRPLPHLLPFLPSFQSLHFLFLSSFLFFFFTLLPFLYYPPSFPLLLIFLSSLLSSLYSPSFHPFTYLLIPLLIT
ncbi:unnamed protein product [Acanthosepion pharaonis]|uniref:Uncharacterized protein n=1 Tax=Acanthosepion pharaonis TaxID=158019 RepID=A0A812BBX6_ACAPH|nr:unnamed protein product [Sepia pharaonis]